MAVTSYPFTFANEGKQTSDEASLSIVNGYKRRSQLPTAFIPDTSVYRATHFQLPALDLHHYLTLNYVADLNGVRFCHGRRSSEHLRS